MAARKQINRYKSTPYGKNRIEVYWKAKRFFRTGLNTDSFVIWGDDEYGWQADYPPINQKSNLPNLVRYRWNGTRWEEESEVIL